MRLVLRASTPTRAPGSAPLSLVWTRWVVIVWTVIAAVGIAQAWVVRHVMDPDGVANLDLAHAFLQGDWSQAINRLWSPLYPGLLAVLFWVVRPSPVGEFATAHTLNLFILLGTLASFEFLLRQLIDHHRSLAALAAAEGRMVLPEWSLRVLGYVLFAYSSFGLISLAAVNPDLCMALLVYLAMGLLLKIRRTPTRLEPFLLLGVVLGLGYLAKAPMWPLALVFLALCGAMMYRQLPAREVARRLFIAVVPFVVITGALVTAFARTGQGVTLGVSGKLNYAYHINGLPYVHWQGDIPGSGRPLHPTRLVFSSPPVYEFSSPVRGTYPPWDDPAYWYEGVTVHFDARSHLHNLVRSVRVLLGVVVRSQLSLVAGGAVLLYMGHQGRSVWRAWRVDPVFYFPALAAVCMFSAVWLERRFIAPFVAPFWLGFFASLTFAESARRKRAIQGITMATLAVLILLTSPAVFVPAKTFASGRADSQFAVAASLRHLGVRPGAPLAVISDWPGGSDAYWALLARVRIIAEMPACRAYAGSFCPVGPRDGVSAFVQAAPDLQARILNAFQRTGAEGVVMRSPTGTLPGWRPLSDTGYAVYLFANTASTKP